MPMAIIAFWICGPREAVIAIASTSAGNASSASMTRIASRSKVPPRYPARSPTETPTRNPMLTEMTPTDSEMREPQRTRENTSRPRSSVPSRWSRLGPSLVWPMGRLGSSNGRTLANTARKTMRPTHEIDSQFLSAAKARIKATSSAGK